MPTERDIRRQTDHLSQKEPRMHAAFSRLTSRTTPPNRKEKHTPYFTMSAFRFKEVGFYFTEERRVQAFVWSVVIGDATNFLLPGSP
jgi:hypothetical protein